MATPDGEKTVAVIYLVGIFGDCMMGDIFCRGSNAIHVQHNADGHTSVTYIDDGTIVDHPDLIEPSIEGYLTLLRALFGPEAANLEKVESWVHELIALGWHFDFAKWNVLPKQKGLDKLLVALFGDMKLGARVTTQEHWDTVIGLLNWYSQAIPASAAFLASLYKCTSGRNSKKRRKKKNRNARQRDLVHLTALAKSDLDFLRAIVLVAHFDRSVMAASISRVRLNKDPSRHLTTDASTTVGFGGYLSLTHGGPAVPGCDGSSGGAARWSRLERRLFEELGISINVLEFFGVLFYILLWAHHLQGHVVRVNCDNTSAVSWLMRNRTKCGGVADVLVKLYVLFTLRHDITIVGLHIKGSLNVIADFNSRDLLLRAQDEDESVTGTLCGPDSRALTRAERCRRLLLICVTKPHLMRGPSLVDELCLLDTTPGGSFA